MSLLEQALLTHRLWPEQIIRLDADLYLMLADLATAQDKSIPDLVAGILYDAVRNSREQDHADLVWHTLTLREKQITALTCLGLTNGEIGRHLAISINTVRSHVRNILDKYRVASKTDLRLALIDWDFRAWLETPS